MQKELDGHDINAYIKEINSYYSDSSFLTREWITKFGCIDLLDPFLLFSIYAAIIGRRVQIPTLKLGQIGYLPALRAVLTPYGPEISLKNHLYYGSRYFQVNLNYGRNDNKNSFLAEFVSEKIIEIGSYVLGGVFALWRQPALNYTRAQKEIEERTGHSIFINETHEMAQSKMGNHFGLSVGRKLGEKFLLGLEGGYKTEGFLAGRPVKSGVLCSIILQLDWT